MSTTGAPDHQHTGHIDTPCQQGESPARTVASPHRRPGTPAAERKRQQRQRDRALLFQRDDWQLFLDPETLPQKAGCQPYKLRSIVLREIVDNALDAGAKASLSRDEADGTWIVADDGPGLDPADVPRLFAVNRPLISSKRRRLPLRGMLGNGLRVVMGAVAASDGRLIVETRRHRLTLAVDCANGTTKVVEDTPIPFAPGLTVYLTIGPQLPRYPHYEGGLASTAIALASHGKGYSGPSSPWWYSARDLHRLMEQVMPTDTTVARLCRELGFAIEDDRIARTLGRDEADAVLSRLRASTKPVPPEQLGMIGPTPYPDRFYASKVGFTRGPGLEIPFVAEAWATFTARPTDRSTRSAELSLLLNRTPSAATILAGSCAGGLLLEGCGLDRNVPGIGPGDYTICISIIAPYIELATDGKQPALEPFGEAIIATVRNACSAAHRALRERASGTSIKDAAWAVLPAAYHAASGAGRYPANARQIMYAARPDILKLTGKTKLDDHYFTQTVLPDYMEQHPEQTRDWDVVFDARGSFIEPHTKRGVSLGTVEVRHYLGDGQGSLTHPLL